ncbi:MAG: glycosyltransferase 87 family protein [Acidobacteriota bacterium]
MQEPLSASRYAATFGLLAIALALGAVFYFAARFEPLDHYVPEFVALMLLAGILYLVGVYLVQRSKGGPATLLIILAAAVGFRLFFLPLNPTLSHDVYRYQWDGRVERAHINPYTVYPAMPGLSWAENPEHPIETGRTTPTLYPPISELAFSSVQTIAGYKRLFTGFDLATLALLLALLAATARPLQHVLIYAWNPAVLVAFSMSGHNDALAILTLVAAILVLIIGRRGLLSIGFLALSFLSKLFPAFLLPLFLKRTRWSYAGIFAGLVLLGYLPFLGAGGHLFRGLSDFTAKWQGNDSLYRLFIAAGNSERQAQMVAGILLLLLIVYVLKARMDIFRAGLIILSGLLFLSPNAFPWYFTWLVPFLCFDTNPALLLLTVSCVLAYSPVIAYAAGGSFANSPLMLVLEYLPVYAWLSLQMARSFRRRQTQ